MFLCLLDVLCGADAFLRLIEGKCIHRFLLGGVSRKLCADLPHQKRCGAAVGYDMMYVQQYMNLVWGQQRTGTAERAL